jgi:hypothetical protein
VSDPVRDYQAALRTFEEATRKAEALATALSEAADLLRNWAFVTVSPGFDFPAELTRAPSIDGARWPFARQIGETLAAWHAARAAVTTAWAELPDYDRTGLVPPPGRREASPPRLCMAGAGAPSG